MKKIILAFSVLLSLGLTACSSNYDDNNAYRGEVVFSAYEGDNLKLTIRKNNCDMAEQSSEVVVLQNTYDSNIVVGSCVLVSMDENGTSIKNISRSKSKSYLSRTGQH